jgi:hypothetical protein
VRPKKGLESVKKRFLGSRQFFGPAVDDVVEIAARFGLDATALRRVVEEAGAAAVE